MKKNMQAGRKSPKTKTLNSIAPTILPNSEQMDLSEIYIMLSCLFLVSSTRCL